MSGQRPRLALVEWFTGKYSRAIRWAVTAALLLLVLLVTYRLILRGIAELLAVDPALVLNTSVQLYAIINPLSTLPTFLYHTQDLPEDGRAKVVRTTTTIVMALLFGFALFGPLILDALKVTVDSFQLGGGILLMVLAVDMLGGTARTKTVDPSQMAVVPMATPLLVGPGTMTTLIVLTGTIPLVNVLLGAGVAGFAVYLTLRYSPRLLKVIGPNGITVAGRLMSIVLAAVAANMVHSALKAWGIAS